MLTGEITSAVPNLHEKSLSIMFNSRLMCGHFPKRVTTETAVQPVLPRYGKSLTQTALDAREQGQT